MQKRAKQTRHLPEGRGQIGPNLSNMMAPGFHHLQVSGVTKMAYVKWLIEYYIKEVLCVKRLNII